MSTAGSTSGGAITRFSVAAGAALAALAVLSGAFGAHALKHTLDADRLAIWDTAAEYQFGHALGLVLVGLLSGQQPASVWLRCSAVLMVLGIALFSGSLYLYVLSELRGFALLTPVGGVSLVAAWISLLVHALRMRTVPATR